MTDHIQELRAFLEALDSKYPDFPYWTLEEREAVRVRFLEALDGWEKAENVNAMLKKALAAKVGAKRAPLKGSDLEFVLERAERAEAELARLREAALGWANSAELIETGGDAVELAQRIRDALTQEKNDE